MPFRPALRAILEVPLLHRRAPHLLVVAGLAVAASFGWGIKQRIDDGHRDGMKVGIQTAQYAADAAQQLLRARLQSVQQAVYVLERATRESPQEANEVLADRDAMGLPKVVLMWADTDGKVAYASDEALLQQQVPVQWVEQVAASNSVHLAVRVPQEYGLPAGVPAIKAATVAGHRGVLVAVFPEAQFLACVKKVLGELNGYVALRSAEGQLTAAATAKGLVGQGSDKLLARSAFLEPGQLPTSTSTDYFAATSHDEKTGISVVAGVDTHEALADWEVRRAKTLWMSGAMGAVVLLLILGSAWALRRSARVEGKLRALVALDHLTQLPNRRTFTELLELEVAKSASGEQLVGLMFIDLDNFKYVNDSLGHDVGDRLLVQVGERLLRSVRNSDVVCRIGGDEFTVVLPALVGPRDAEMVAKRILDALAVPMQFGDVTLSVRASIGIAMSPVDARHTTQLVQCADMAVYKAKEMGKGCFARFEPRLLDASLARSALTHDLRDAVTNKQFHLLYQPKVCMKSGAVSSFEALLRWDHPRRGAVSPGEFIPVAEESDVILDIGDFVIEEAVSQVRAWNDAGLGWQTVAVNVSARQLRNGHVAKTLRRCLSRHRVPGQYLQIELTETMLASDVEQAARTLAELKMMGVAIAVDDFGTGYSSLSALQQLDVDCIKVDRSFVANIETSHESAEICRAVVQLAHSMDLRVVAEGIESLAQYQYLMELGCHEGQGYYFAPPMPADEAIAYNTSITLFAPM